MTITEIIEGIGELARRSNMTFEEAVEWISRNDRDENILPWEDEKMELSIEELHEIAAIVQTYILLHEEMIETSKCEENREFYKKKIVRAEQLRNKLIKIHTVKLMNSIEKG